MSQLTGSSTAGSAAYSGQQQRKLESSVSQTLYEGKYSRGRWIPSTKSPVMKKCEWHDVQSGSAKCPRAIFTHMVSMTLKVRSHMRGRTRAEAGGKLASTQIITCVHICAVAERRRSRSRIRSARNGSNTQFSASASKPRAPNHHCPQEMADPPAPAPRMCEHTRGSGAGISKSTRLRSATAPRMCERSLRYGSVASIF